MGGPPKPRLYSSFDLPSFSGPTSNAFIERFNRSYREEVLDAYLFDSLEQVRAITETWLETYNTERPHESLGQVPPLSFP